MKITGSSEMNVLHYAAVEGADEAMACLVELSELILCQVLKSTLVGGSWLPFSIFLFLSLLRITPFLSQKTKKHKTLVPVNMFVPCSTDGELVLFFVML